MGRRSFTKYPDNDNRVTDCEYGLCSVSGKGRLYPAYSLSGSEGEENSTSLRSGRAYPLNNHPISNQVQHNHYNTSQHKQRAYQHPLFHVPGSGAGLSDTPTSGNASDETLTDSELTNLARDSTLLVHNGQ